MKIMGVDPGTIKTGWGLIDYVDGEFREPSLCGVISAPSAWRISQRLMRIYSNLDAIVEEHQPDVIAVETPFVGPNPQTAMRIGQAQALAMLVAEHWTIRLAYYTPAEVKRAVTSSGRSDKHQVARSVLTMLNVDAVGTLDATDALAVAVCHANRRDEAAILQRVDRP